MLELQMRVLSVWFEAGVKLRSAHQQAVEDRDRGEVTATTALIVLMVIAAITAGTIIATRITSNANNVPTP